MPELPEVETVCRGLAPVMVGRRIAQVTLRRPDLRVALPRDLVRRMEGRRVAAIRRRAKYILIELDSPDVVILHLGMSGRISIAQGDVAPARHDHVVIALDDGTRIAFNDARRFGLMLIAERTALARHKLFAGLGPEPLSEAFDGAALAARLKGKKTPIKAALLDQRVVAGLGNIYVCEALFRAGVSPKRLARSIGGDKAAALAAAVKTVLAKAIAAGGSSLRDYVQPSGELGYFQHQWAVYDKEGAACPGCGCDIARSGGIKRIVQSGRSTFYCPRRQR